MDIINRLFALEKEFRGLNLTVPEIKKRRELESSLIVNEYEAFINSISCEATSLLGKAVAYSKELMPNLRTFLLDGHIEISNNIPKRAIKPFVIARKNFLLSYSLDGARASAINFSIIQTARANGLNVTKYIEYVLSELATITTKQLPDLLPWSSNIINRFKITEQIR